MNYSLLAKWMQPRYFINFDGLQLLQVPAQILVEHR